MSVPPAMLIFHCKTLTSISHNTTSSPEVSEFVQLIPMTEAGGPTYDLEGQLVIATFFSTWED
jgi:hypothetical protein